MNEALIARIEAAAGALTDRVLAEMYVDPFWVERFGERAHKHGRQDGLFHIKYLAEALRGNDPNVIEQYARWLQQLLTTRGMCTRHLDENFERLARAIGETVPDSAPAEAMLAAARGALRYAGGPARKLQDHALRIAERIVAERSTKLIDVLTHLSYAADALALGMPSVFTSHVAWTEDFDTVAALRAVVTAELGVVLP